MTITNARHLLLHLSAPATLPDALLAALRDDVILAGWVRATGVLADVELRAVDPRTGAAAGPRRLTGAVQAVTLEGVVAYADDVTCVVRGVLARETESGLETIAGEIVAARIVTLDAFVTALDDAPAAHAGAPAPLPAAPVASPAPIAPAAPEAPAAASAPPAAAAPPLAPQAAAAAAPPPAAASAATTAAAQAEPPKPAAPKPSPTYGSSGQPMPVRPARPQAPPSDDDDQPYPEPGDLVEHFAFGRCEVVKSDGDRLHVRLGKDGRIKEIALEMLKVTPLPAVEGTTGKHFKLDRKL